MTVGEFKAWLEGYTENGAIDGSISKKQWARIKERIAEIKEAPAVTWAYGGKRSWLPHQPYYYYYTNTGGTGIGTQVSNTAGVSTLGLNSDEVNRTFYAQGKADAAANS